jgi:hypothetical protein
MMAGVPPTWRPSRPKRDIFYRNDFDWDGTVQLTPVVLIHSDVRLPADGASVPVHRRVVGDRGLKHENVCWRTTRCSSPRRLHDYARAPV